MAFCHETRRAEEAYRVSATRRNDVSRRKAPECAETDGLAPWQLDRRAREVAGPRTDTQAAYDGNTRPDAALVENRMDTTTLTLAALTLAHALVARLALRALVRPAAPRRHGWRRTVSDTHDRWRQLR